VGGIPNLRPLKIRIVQPGLQQLTTGNSVTARRWAAILRGLGHRVSAGSEWTGQPCDLLVALHARKSHASITRFREAHPGKPLVVALTGTDLYRDVRSSKPAQASLACASRLVVLQPCGVAALPAKYRRKTGVIRQSARCPGGSPAARGDLFEVCVLSHLRRVKDPFRTARAARLLPASSRIRILHAGEALEPGMAAKARAHERASARYRWLDALPRAQALRLLGRSRLLVLTSRIEGGANVVAEALACGVPIISSRIDGILGTLGRDYPGYFRVGDTRGLAKLLRRFETDAVFHRALARHCRRLMPLVDPARERRSWKALLNGLRRWPSTRTASTRRS
jgi:putative glycosyltransferase (TIGR04348 family)